MSLWSAVQVITAGDSEYVVNRIYLWINIQNILISAP